eukprot:3297076-Amphidinium_carterae.1
MNCKRVQATTREERKRRSQMTPQVHPPIPPRNDRSLLAKPSHFSALATWGQQGNESLLVSQDLLQWHDVKGLFRLDGNGV